MKSGLLEPVSIDPSLPGEPRLDPATLQQVIALAGEMQASDRATLSLAEAESIAEQVGVEPRFVRAVARQLVADYAKQPNRGGLTAAELAEDDEACGTSLFSKCAFFKAVAFAICGGMIGAVGAYAFSMPLLVSLLAVCSLTIGACHVRRASAAINAAVLTVATLVPVLILDGSPNVPRVIAATIVAGIAGWIGSSLRLTIERALVTRRQATVPGLR